VRSRSRPISRARLIGSEPERAQAPPQPGPDADAGHRPRPRRRGDRRRRQPAHPAGARRAHRRGLRKLGARNRSEAIEIDGTRAGCDDRAIGRMHGGYTAGMFGRERVVPSILAAVGAVLAGVLVGSGFAGHSAGGVINAVAVQAVMPPAAPASIPDPSDPSAAKGASVGRRVAIALRGAPVAHVAAPAATRPSRSARAVAARRLGEVKADPPAPRPAASRASQRRHHPHAGRGHRHPARRHSAGRHHARGHHRRHRAHHQR